MILAFSKTTSLGATGAVHLLFQSSFPNERPQLGLIELFKFDDFYEISLGVAVVFLFMAIGWSMLLRRKVREQREALREQFARETALQQRYQDLFENANDLIFTLDPRGFMLALNHTGEVLLGCPRERARTMRLDAFLIPAPISKHGWPVVKRAKPVRTKRSCSAPRANGLCWTSSPDR